MKKYILISTLVFLLSGVSAQKSNVQSAANKFKDNEIEAAKKYIDLAAENPQTSNDFKMWYYKGQIYWVIATDTKYNNISTDAVETATTSYINCLKTDEKGWYKNDVSKILTEYCAIALYNKAAEVIKNGNDSKKAIQLYMMIFDIIPYDQDNALARNNISPEILYRNCYLASNQTKDYVTSKTYIQKLIDLNYNDPLIYIDMTYILLDEKDTVQALKYITLGRDLFEDNPTLMDIEMEIYFKQGKIDVLLTKLSDAIGLNPSNELLYLSRGTMFEKIQQYDKAESDYKKAVELNPNNFDAQYSAGLLHFNIGVDYNNKADGISNFEKSQIEAKKAKEQWELALPYLEKAYQIKPDDKNTMTALKTLYARIGMMEKYKEINDKLQN